jgi:hypothetical protein
VQNALLAATAKRRDAFNVSDRRQHQREVIFMKLAPWLLSALLFCTAACAQTPGSSPANPNSATQTSAATAPVPIKDEPHHRLVLKNDFVNVYNVSVPPLDATLLHQHDLPYIGVPLGPADLVNVVTGKPETHLTLQDGETRYFSERYSHLVRTDSGLPFWNITVEFVHPQGVARNLCKQVIEGPLACPQQSAAGKNASESADDDIPSFETDEFRIDQIKVALGKDYAEAAPKQNALLIALSNANLDATLGTEHVSFLHAGDILWLPAGADRKVVDFLGTKSSFLLVSFKDSVTSTKP